MVGGGQVKQVALSDRLRVSEDGCVCGVSVKGAAPLARTLTVPIPGCVGAWGWPQPFCCHEVGSP